MILLGEHNGYLSLPRARTPKPEEKEKALAISSLNKGEMSAALYRAIHDCL